VYTKTIIDGRTFFEQSFVRNLGIYLGDPPKKKPKISREYSLIADMVFEMDIHSFVPLTQEVNSREDYKECYDRFLLNNKLLFPTTVELYIVKNSEIEKCNEEILDPKIMWPLDLL
jgi:hypothetical protein